MLNQRGFSLVEVIVAAGISTVVVLGASSLFIDSAKIESAQERQFWIAARRMEFQNHIRSQAGWNSVLASNTNMACFTNGTSCAAFTTTQPLSLTLDGTVLNGASNNTGMMNKGDFCNSFDPDNGNSACPVGIKLEWVALQELKSYDLVIFKDPKLESLNEVCTAMGGVLVGTTCTRPAAACDPSNALGAGATFPLGFDNLGAVICGQPNPGSCAASDVATGFDGAGAIRCGPACL
jgi:prepilin-type N-terminal cleavage/methylation domain-containing protein